MDSSTKDINANATSSNVSANATPPPTDNEQKTIEDTLTFLNTDILELMGAKNMPKEQKDRIYQKMMSTIQNRVMARVLDGLTEEQYQKIKSFLDSNDENAFIEYADKIGINLPQIYSEEALLYKIEMVNLIKSSKKTGDN